MNVKKKVLTNLDKCYSIAPLRYQGDDYFLVAAEKIDRCLLFNQRGNLVDTIWNEPGGVMSMVQVPGSNGQFLATQKFYSPNDSKEAKIVVVTPVAKGNWQVRTLAAIPHVHRFDIIERNNIRYLIACALKSGHEYKDDWSSPGKVYGAVLPEDLSSFDDEHPLSLTVLKENMLKNHGYYRILTDGIETGLISAENGIFQFIPPETPEASWEIKQLLDMPASDAVLVDLDEDGEPELVVLSPFHGENIYIYKKQQEGYVRVYEYAEKAEFTHAIYGGLLAGRPAAVIGHRQGARKLIAFSYNQETGSYAAEVLDEGCGPANIFHYQMDGKDIVIAANREIDEIAMYEIQA